MTESNPNPDKITDEMWKLWTDRPNPNWKLSGIYAFKEYYHSSVIENQKNWPGNYSIKLELDLKHGNLDKARAIDLTMSDSEMVKWTTRMKKSAEDPNDFRLAAVREFYGTLDNKTVFGLIKDTETGPWRRSSSDLTHLWHGHKSIFTAFVRSWPHLESILSVEKGESLREWESAMFPQKDDVGEDVKYWQYVHNYVRTLVDPDSPELKIDGEYGPATVAAFTDFAKKNGAGNDYVANRITGWLAFKYNTAMIRYLAPKTITVPPPVTIDPGVLQNLVETWLEVHIPGQLKITGDIKGVINL